MHPVQQGLALARKERKMFGRSRTRAQITRGRADIAQHRTGFHRRELVLVAREHQPRGTGQGLQRAREQRQIDHRSFVD